MIKFIGMLTAVGIGLVARAYVLTCLWAWFVVPLGVQSITMPQSYGLSVIFVLWSMKAEKASKNTEKYSAAESTGISILASLSALGLGFLAKQLM